jgi:tetratricopeptide (TPR) repeat protein
VEVSDTELTSSLQNESRPRVKRNWFERALQAWIYEKNDESAVDLLDAALLSRQQETAFEAAAYIVGRADHVADRVLLAATHVLANKQIALFDYDLKAESAQASAEIIRRLKARIRIHERDPITAVELARLYARQGQHGSAVDAMNIAVALAPNNRFVLRSATRLYTMLGDGQRALTALRRSDSIRHDPWLQSAEIATSELADTPSRFASVAARLLRGAAHVPSSMSELAMALATLEEKSGAKRRAIYRLIKAALSHPTENALTQAVWLVENTGSYILEKFPDLTFPREAFEARALERYEHGDFLASERHCALWVRDQPFQSRGPLMLSGINLVHFGKYNLAASVAEQAMQIHPQDWSILNSAAIARALDGDLEGARKHIQRMRSLCKSDVPRAFLLAAQGLLAFQEGDVESGRKLYESSFELSRKAKRSDLVATAAMYYVEMEAKAGWASEEDIITFVKNIDSIVLTKFKSRKDGVLKTWVSRRTFVDRHLLRRGNDRVDRIIAPASTAIREFPKLHDTELAE